MSVDDTCLPIVFFFSHTLLSSPTLKTIKNLETLNLSKSSHTPMFLLYQTVFQHTNIIIIPSLTWLAITQYWSINIDNNLYNRAIGTYELEKKSKKNAWCKPCVACILVAYLDKPKPFIKSSTKMKNLIQISFVCIKIFTKW